MLSEQLQGYLHRLAQVAAQPPNRWDGFDLSAPDAPATSLRDQIFFAGLAATALALHPNADALQREQARSAVYALVERLLQRRVWAAWANATERAGLLPDPISAGGGAYAGRLAMLLGCAALVQGAPLYNVDPFVLRWSSTARYGTTYSELVTGLSRLVAGHPDGAVASAGDATQPHDMAHILWALQLHDHVCGSDFAPLGERWLATLRNKLAQSGPQLLNPGALRSHYHLERRRAPRGNDPLVDSWALALTAPFDPPAVSQLAERFTVTLPRLQMRKQVLPIAFAYLLGVQLDAPELAESARTWLTTNAPLPDDTPSADPVIPAGAWLHAVIMLGDAGGLRLPPAHGLLAEAPAAPHVPAEELP
jgi:hypothetical protein